MNIETTPNGIKFDWWIEYTSKDISCIRFKYYFHRFDDDAENYIRNVFKPVMTEKRKEDIAYCDKIMKFLLEYKNKEFTISKLTNDKDRFLNAIKFLSRTEKVPKLYYNDTYIKIM